MKQYSRNRITTLASLFATCAVLGACGGGGGGDSADKSSQAVTPTSQPAAAASAADAASSAASAVAVVAEAASAAASTAAAASGETVKVAAGIEKTPVTATTTTTTPVTVAQTLSQTTTPVTTTPVVTATTPTTPASSTATPIPLVEAPATAAAPAGCNMAITRSFGSNCLAAGKANLPSGGSATFPNFRAGYKGSVTATCQNGTVTWDTGTCTVYSVSTAKLTAEANTLVAASSGSATNTYNIGVYYYGGWKDNQVGSSWPKPWEPLMLYTDREPLLGRYAEDAPGIMSQQLKWMSDYGINFTVFNWFWGGDNKAYLTHSVDAYIASTQKYGVKFAVQWSNHEGTFYTKQNFEAMFKFWATNYFNKADYLRIDGKPAMYIFLTRSLSANASAIGMTSAALLKLADDIAKQQGLPGVTFVGGQWGGDPSMDYNPANTGYGGFTMYNYRAPASIALYPLRPGNVARSYAELDTAYRNQWDWTINNSSGFYLVPMSSGWDMKPWGGSEDPQQDDSVSIPVEFYNHLLAARKLMNDQPTRTRRTGIICCWNEFGEGSYIEPTKMNGFKYLEQVKAVFKPN